VWRSDFTGCWRSVERLAESAVDPMAWIDSTKVGGVHGMCGTTACRREGTTRGREVRGPRPFPEGGCEIAPPARMTPGGAIGVLERRPGSLTTDGCMCVVVHVGHWRWPTGGWRSHTRSRDSRVGASFVRRAIAGCLASMSLKPWRNGERARLSLGRVRVRVPSASSGSCSSPVERLVEAQRGAGSIPAGATCCRRGGMHTRDAQNVVGHVPVRVRIPPAVLAAG
jgi:hypothetical protein